MNLCEKWRKRIVKKLIRPEDGYMFVGLSDGEPIKLYKEAYRDHYLLGMKSGSCNYLEPTLSGWHTYEPALVQPYTVDFKSWVYGILNNVYDEHCKRIDGLTRKDFNLKRNSTGDVFMINKQSFCDIMNALDVYWKNVSKLENILDVIFEQNMLTEILDAIVKALEEDLEPDLDFDSDPTLYTWLFEMDAGRNEKAKDGIDGHPLTTAEQLYDYLIWKRDNRPLDKLEDM